MDAFKGLMYGTLFSLPVWALIIFLIVGCGDEETEITVEPVPVIVNCAHSQPITHYEPVPTLPPINGDKTLPFMIVCECENEAL